MHGRVAFVASHIEILVRFIEQGFWEISLKMGEGAYVLLLLIGDIRNIRVRYERVCLGTAARPRVAWGQERQVSFASLPTTTLSQPYIHGTFKKVHSPTSHVIKSSTRNTLQRLQLSRARGKGTVCAALILLHLILRTGSAWNGNSFPCIQYAPPSLEVHVYMELTSRMHSPYSQELHVYHPITEQ